MFKLPDEDVGNHGQESMDNICPGQELMKSVSDLYDRLAAEGFVPNLKKAGRPRWPKSHAIAALVWHEEGESALDIGAAITCLQQGLPLNRYREFLDNSDAIEAYERKGRRAISAGKKLDNEIKKLMKDGNAREDFEQKLLNSPEEMKKRFILLTTNVLNLTLNRLQI